MTVTTFVLARIDEDEERSRIFTLAYAHLKDGLGRPLSVIYPLSEFASHTRVLAQCAALRKIVDLNSWVDHSGNRIEYGPDCVEEMAALASIWSDHPDWREEWA